MAFNTGNNNHNAQAFKKYIGIATVKVLSCNPDLKELSTIYGTTLTNEPVYTLPTQDDGIQRIKIMFYLKTDDVLHKGVNLIVPLTFILTNNTVIGKNSGKIQVIDKYGRCGWVTKEELAQHIVPEVYIQYGLLDNSYVPAIGGEELLMKFLKAYANTPNLHYTDFKTNKIVTIKDPSKAEARFENIKKLFENDFSEINNILLSTIDYMVRVSVGIKTTEDNKQYYEVFNKAFQKMSAKNFDSLIKAVKQQKENGAYANTEFADCPLKEYVIEKTEFAENTTQEVLDSIDNSEDLPEWLR
jgi:hypothetical protein